MADYDEIDDEEKAACKAVNSLIPTIVQSRSNNYSTSQTVGNEYELPTVCHLNVWLNSISPLHDFDMQETIISISNQEGDISLKVNG